MHTHIFHAMAKKSSCLCSLLIFWSLVQRALPNKHVTHDRHGKWHATIRRWRLWDYFGPLRRIWTMVCFAFCPIEYSLWLCTCSPYTRLSERERLRTTLWFANRKFLFSPSGQAPQLLLCAINEEKWMNKITPSALIRRTMFVQELVPIHLPLPTWTWAELTFTRCLDETD